MKGSRTLFTIVLTLSFIFLAACSGNSDDPGMSPVSKMTPTDVAAENLYMVYRENEIAGDKRYKDKVIAVTGTVHSIGKDIFNHPYVLLQSKNGEAIVHCSFENAERTDALASLKSGQQVRIRGRCGGFSLGMVTVKECLLP